MKEILITGVSGFIGEYLASILNKNYKIIGVDIDGFAYKQCDYFYQYNITNFDDIEKIFKIHNIDYVIHTAAEKSLVKCEKNMEKACKINYLASKFLYELSEKNNAKFIFISSDQVFDGLKGNYNEKSLTKPINYYGKLKVLVENEIKEKNNAVICRTALTFGKIPENQIDYFNEIKVKDYLVVQGYIVQHVIYKLSQKENIILPQDEYVTPTSLELLGKQIKNVILYNATGILHCCGGERISRYEFGKKIANIFNLDDKFIKPNSSNDKLRPKDVSLNTDYSSKKLNLCYWGIDEMLKNLKDELEIN